MRPPGELNCRCSEQRPLVLLLWHLTASNQSERRTPAAGSPQCIRTPAIWWHYECVVFLVVMKAV